MSTDDEYSYARKVLVRARELAQGQHLTEDIVYKAARELGLHMGATYVEVVGYIEREIGREL